ncbi:MAG TPA: hypothetical protein VF551_04250 [Chthoniobacterales bacterium]
MKREDDHELWDLLGRAEAPAVSPFFARNVVRQIRQESSWRGTLIGWLRPRILVPSAALALVAALAALSLDRPATDVAVTDDPPDALAVVDPQDYEVVADLDDLLAVEDDNLWDDEISSL